MAIFDSTSEDATLDALVGNLMTKMDSNTKGLIASLPPYQSWILASTHNTMIDYWHYTGNDTYADETASGIVTQAGPQGDFSGSISPGNDDALWWGLTCISAAEYKLPTSQVGGNTTDWLELAKEVFHSVIARWQPDMCGPGAGGLRWQIDIGHEGYKYKNAITQGLAFQLAARLAALTRENSYEEWASKLFDTSLDAGLIDKSTHQVKDGVHAPVCSQPADERWSYNAGVFMYGAAVMTSLNSSSDGERDTHWQDHAKGFISAAISDFTRNKILYEPRCEDTSTCNTDQQTFKSYLARWMGMTATLLPKLRGEVSEVLKASKSSIGKCTS
ncbi:putative glycoside hydrolase, family 76, six-hairpin glycosidase superfamily [Septoria linicola]|nr:putative glycoside hydrolase, family 76, six-hairpin glycosidase superfamily [Septoria linicola]